MTIESFLVLPILLIALASLVLGMGVPVTAAYLVTAVVAVPALTHLGVNEIAAHMIVYWLSQDFNITPPVCIAAFAGATIAKANMWRTAFASFKFAKFLILDKNIIGYISADRWEEIKSQNVDEAREALIGKRRDHLVIREALPQFSENVKASHEGSGFVTDDILVVRGNPVEQILTQAEQKNCDLIVMGTHGHGTLADVMMGSTARRVLRRSKKPVLVVRLPKEES